MQLTLLFFIQALAWFAFCVSLPLKSEHEKRAVLLLDDFTFSKIVPHPNRDVVVLLAHKSQIGDYGTDSMRTDYFNFAFKMQTNGDADHVLFAQIIVNGGENRQLSEDIVGDEFIHPKLVVFPAGSATPIAYPDDQPYHLNTLTQFVSQHTTLQFQLPGTMKLFDDLAANFLNADESRQRGFIAEAELALEGLTDTAQEETAAYYVRLMNKILENGLGYIQTEIKRHKKVLVGEGPKRLTKAGQRNFENHLNVLHHFAASAPTSSRDEV